MRKFVFLDVDGVLNNQETFRKVQRHSDMLDPYLVLLANRIVERTGAEVVLSSSWRHGFFEDLKRDLPFPLLDRTGSCCTGIRGAEIHAWLNRNVPGFSSTGYDDKRFRVAILDDESDMLLWQKDCFFKTSFETGLTEEIAERVISHLNS